MGKDVSCRHQQSGESKDSMKTGIINDEERERFYKEWQEVLRMGDSYYNSNYAKQGALYILE